MEWIMVLQNLHITTRTVVGVTHSHRHNFECIAGVTGRFGPIPVWTLGGFGPIPFRSGHFGLGLFGPILEVGCFGLILLGHFGPLYFI